MDLLFFIKFIQLISGIVAMSCIIGAFKVINGYQLGSPDFTFLFLTNFCIWIYSMFFIGYTLYRLSYPEEILTWGIEVLFIVFLFSGGIAGTFSNVYQDCSKLANVSCNTLMTGILFTFLNMILFIVSLLRSIKNYKDNIRVDDSIIKTPRNCPI